MVDFRLSAEDQTLIDKAKELAKGFAERARTYDDDASFPKEDFDEIKKAGFHKLALLRELGGHGMWRDDRYVPFYLILEALAAGNASTAQLVQIQAHATGIIGNLGNEEQKQRILGDVAERDVLIASLGSEVNPHQLQSTNQRAELEQVDGGFRVNAVKQFGSLSPAADYYLVYLLAPGAASAAEGMVTAVIPHDAPGATLQDNWDVMGMRATISWSLKLEDVFIPWENVIGEPGDWVQKDPRTFTLAYVSNHLGTAQGVYDFLIEYMNERRFLMNDDVNLYNMGEMSAALQSTRTSMMYAAWLWEQGDYEKAEKASMRVLHTSKETALKVTTLAFDVCGARAAFKHFPIERAYRDVRTFSLHFRESQLLRLLMEAELGEDFHSKQRYGPKVEQKTWEKLGIKQTSARA